MIKVSVVVPVYNVEKYIDKCLNSLVNQTFNDYEILVVNDGSPDNSQKIVDRYVSDYPDKVFSYIKENGGISSVRNFGILNAKGEYVVFIDSDDFVSENYIELLYNKMIENDNDIVFSDVYRKSQNKLDLMLGFNDRGGTFKQNALLSLPAVWNKMYKKSLFINNNIFYPENIPFGEDLAVTSKLILHAKKIGYVNTPLYYYLIREGSVTNQKRFNPKWLKIFVSVDSIIEYYQKQGKFEEYMSEIEYLAISNVLHGLAIYVYRYDEALEIFRQINKYMKQKFPNYQKNKYYRQENWKFKLVCKLIKNNQVSIMRKILK